MVDGPSPESDTLASIRTLLLAALAAGVIGTLGELILLRHIDMPAQWIPMACLAASVPVLICHASSPGVASGRPLQALMAAFIVLGGGGVGPHYGGNVEVERG